MSDPGGPPGELTPERFQALLDCLRNAGAPIGAGLSTQGRLSDHQHLGFAVNLAQESWTMTAASPLSGYTNYENGINDVLGGLLTRIEELEKRLDLLGGLIRTGDDVLKAYTSLPKRHF